MGRKYSTVDDIYALLQRYTVTGLAKKLRVHRTTVQRWKNKGVHPVERNEKKLTRRAAETRTAFRREGRSRREHWKAPALAVPLMGRRQYVTEEIKPTRSPKKNKEAYDAAKKRSKELNRKYDRFFTRKDAKGRTHYFRSQDAGAVVFDGRRARDQDLINLILAYHGRNLGIVIVHVLTKEYKMKDGTILPAGTHLGSRPESLNQAKFASADGILDFLNERKRKGRIAFIRITGQ